MGIKERRSILRFNLPIKMCGMISICNVKGRIVTSKASNICIKDISPKGIGFSTEMDLIKDNIEYKVYFILFDKKYIVPGEIVWKEREESGTIRYGFKFNIAKERMDEFSSLFTKLLLKSKFGTSKLYRNCSETCPESYNNLLEKFS